MYLMASPDARGLFSKAIAQSAYIISTPELKQHRFGAAAAEESGTKLAAALVAGEGRGSPHVLCFLIMVVGLWKVLRNSK